MKYMGSKSRIAKYIVPILQSEINKNGIKEYIEPFCGGCNVIDKIKCDKKVANDLNKFLIALFIHLKNDGELPSEVSRELYNKVKKDYKNNVYEDWYCGAIGFLASYNGKFFDGGYAKSGYETTKSGVRLRDYFKESSNNILKQIPNLLDVDFISQDYLLFAPKNALIYCDPPYKNTTQYNISKNFDYEKFWAKIREWSKDNIVLVSELIAPDDFEVVWQQEVSRSLNASGKTKAIEKLFRYKG